MAGMAEVVCTLGFAEGVESFADLLLSVIKGTLGGASDQRFEFSEGVPDWVQVR